MNLRSNVRSIFLSGKDIRGKGRDSGVSMSSSRWCGIRSAKISGVLLFLPFLILLSRSTLFAVENNNRPLLPPVAVCRNISVQLGPGGTVSISGPDVDGGSYDPDGTIVSRSVTPNTFTCSQAGSNNVTLTVTDNEGLTGTCTATVIVSDNTAPSMACRSFTLYLDATGRGTLTIADIDNGSADNCSAAPTMSLSRTSFDCSDTGSPVSVTLTGTDDSGNSASCTAQVTVMDTISPSVNVKAYNLVLDPSGNATLLPGDVDNGSFDNCGPVTLSVAPNTFTCDDLGNKTVTLTAQDQHGNSASKNITISVSSTLDIAGMALTSCDLAPTLALYQAEVEGGDGNYSYLWKGLNPPAKPFMVIIPLPPSLQFFSTSILASPFFNNTMANGWYRIRLTITDGEGCRDSSEMRINKTGTVFNNETMHGSEACEGEVSSYSVTYKPAATYSWAVTNGTILTADPDTSRIQVRWNLGITQGTVVATISQPNVLFGGGQCESTVTDSVTVIPVPVPAFSSPVTSVCAGSELTYTLTGTFTSQIWTVTGGSVTAGGATTDNYVTVRWGTGPIGTISVSAGNDPLCEGSSVLNISIFNLSGTITSLTDISCNGASDGSVTVAADAGSGLAPYMYSVDGGSWQGSGTFTGITHGNHTAHIRDALLCTFDIPFVITQPAVVSIMVSARTDVSCFGGSDGSATVVADGGTPPYQYSINVGAYQGQNIFSGLVAGPYSITVRDSKNCTAVTTFNVSQPAAALSGSANVTNVACRGASTGAIDLTASGGTSPYSYQWNNGAVTEDLVNIPAGNYTVVITDSHGCTATVPATVTQPATAVSGSVVVTNVLCFGASTGAVNLTVTGGTPPYGYLWSNGAVTEDLANIPAGVYSVTITDANGCTANASATVTQPAAAVKETMTARTNVSCKGGNNGSFRVAGSGGVPPYQYRLGAGSFQVSGTFSSLTAGIYSVSVRDANLCTATLSVTITEPAVALSGSITSQTNVLCFGGSTGSVTLAGSGGTTPYTYNIDGGSFRASGTFIGLAAGPHAAIVRDKNLCTFAVPVTITQPASAVDGSITSQTNVNCFGASTGSVTAAGSGGTPPYTYGIDGGAYQASGTFNNLAAGNHNVSVRDNNLCTKNIAVVITQPAAALSVTTSKTDALCFGGSSGTATATAAGGTPPYTYSWNTVPAQTGTTATGLPAGSYTVTVADSRACIASGSVIVSQPASPVSGAVSITGVKCNGGSDGAIDLTVLNGQAPETYLWSNGAVTQDLTGLTAGTYSVLITDANGCTGNASGIVGEPAAISGVITVTDVACFGSTTGSCDLTVTGGASPFTFLWSNGSLTEDLADVPAGNYTVTITDSNLCTGVASAVVTQPASALSGSVISQTNVTVYGGSDGSVTVAGSGGTGPYMYRLAPGGFQTSETFISLSAGSYTVTVRDTAMCTYDVPVTITQPWIPLELIIDSVRNVLCAGNNTGVISVRGWGGTSPYTYSLNGGMPQASGIFESLVAGNYLLHVADAASEVFDTLFIITEPPVLSLTVTGVDNVCYAGTAGTTTAAVNGGTGPYIYSWNTSPVQATQTATGLSAGLYSVSVTDSNGCMISGSVTIGQPASEMTLSITKTDVRCQGGSDGSATALPSNGTSPYSYSWSTSPVQTTDSAGGLAAGSYEVTVTDSNGCTVMGSVVITEPRGMEVSETVTPASCPESTDGSIVLNVTGGAQPYLYEWDDHTTTRDRTGVGPGNYSVTITDNDLCTTTAAFTVDFTGSFGCVVIPEIITPNNDGYNDEWRIKNIELYPEAEISVYNRWGKLVFRTTNISANPWDGTVDGKLVPTDSYHYILRLNDGSAPKSGVISVIR